MEILPFDKLNKKYIQQAAELLIACFPQAYSDCADEEMEAVLEDELVALMAVENGNLIGLVGAIPQYDITGWELHPLAVRSEFRGKGIGSQLVAALE